MEVSLETFPANELARVRVGKSAFVDPQTNERAFERMLRDNGFSRSRAKAITAKGFKAADMEACETAEIAHMVDTLKASQLRLEEKYRTRFNVHVRQTETKELWYSIKDRLVTLSITPVDPAIDFDATVKYHHWTANGPEARHTNFRVRNGRGTMSKSLVVRDNKAGILEQIFDAGPRGRMLKRMTVSITSLNKSTSYVIEVG